MTNYIFLFKSNFDRNRNPNRCYFSKSNRNRTQKSHTFLFLSSSVSRPADGEAILTFMPVISDSPESLNGFTRTSKSSFLRFKRFSDSKLVSILRRHLSQAAEDLSSRFRRKSFSSPMRSKTGANFGSLLLEFQRIRIYNRLFQIVLLMIWCVFFFY